MTLYELTGDYKQLAALAADATDPVDAAAFQTTLDGLTDAVDSKVLSCAAVMQNWLAEESGIAKEIERLEKRAESLANARVRLKAYVQTAMETAGIDKVKGTLFTVAIQANPPRTIIDDEAAVPPEYKKIVTTVQAGEIGKALKAGLVVYGAHLEPSRSLRIR